MRNASDGIVFTCDAGWIKCEFILTKFDKVIFTVTSLSLFFCDLREYFGETRDVVLSTESKECDIHGNFD